MLLQHVLITIVSCVLLTTSSGGAKPCISNDASGHCYQIVDANITWTQASSICMDDSGHLIIIESAEEQQFIAGQMQKRNFTVVGLWIGSENVHAEDERTWVNGEKFTYVNWAEGQPDTLPVNENCAEIYIVDGTWNDTPCTQLRGYICEETRNYSDGTEPCMTVGNLRHCYKIVQTEITWAQAFNICSQDGGSLITIESAEEQTFVEDQMKKIKFTVWSLWIGSDKLHPENQRTWANGHKFTYVNWHNGEPNNLQYGENCAEVNTSDSTWNDEICSNLRGYICESTPPSTSQPLALVIGVAVGSALLLLLGVLLLCCLMQKRKKFQKEKRVEVYQDLQEREMNQVEYNQHADLSDTYCTINDN